jgi:hypothetical protein
VASELGAGARSQGVVEALWKQLPRNPCTRACTSRGSCWACHSLPRSSNGCGIKAS